MTAMFDKVRQWLGVGDSERQKLTETEMLPNQDYKMAQSFSGEDIHDINKDAASETTSISRTSSYQKLNGENQEAEATEDKDAETPAKENEEKEGHSLTNASLNFINSIIGAGIIGIPFALHQAGFAFGIILIILIAGLSDYSIVLLIQGGNLANTNSYQGLVKTAFGTTGFLALTAMQFLYPFIAMVGYNVIIGDTVTAVILRIGGDSIKGTALGSRQLIIFVFMVLVMLPLSLYKNVGKIAKASLLSLILTIFVMITLLVKAVQLHGKVPVTEDAWDFAHPDFTQAISILSFEKRWSTVTHISVVTAMVISILFGVLGYITFTGNVRGDLLLSYCTTDDFINVARFAYAMTIVLTWPLECFVTREVIENSIFATKEPQLGRHILITVIIAILTGGISMATDCVEIVLQLNGCLAAIPLAFIFPPLSILRLQQEPILAVKSIPKLMVAIFGIITAIYGLAMTILKIAEGETCAKHGFEPDYCNSDFISTNTSILMSNVTSGQLLNITTSPSS